MARDDSSHIRFATLLGPLKPLLGVFVKPQMILVADPYRSGTNDDPVLIEKNVAAMTEASLRLFRAGHLPVLGEWYALPLIEHVGSATPFSTRYSIPYRAALSPSAAVACASAVHRPAPTKWSTLPGRTARRCTTRQRKYLAPTHEWETRHGEFPSAYCVAAGCDRTSRVASLVGNGRIASLPPPQMSTSL